MFSTLQKTNFGFSVTSILSSANAFDLDKLKILSCGNDIKVFDLYLKVCQKTPVILYIKLFSRITINDRLAQIPHLQMTNLSSGRLAKWLAYRTRNLMDASLFPGGGKPVCSHLSYMQSVCVWSLKSSNVYLLFCSFQTTEASYEDPSTCFQEANIESTQTKKSNLNLLET